MKRMTQTKPSAYAYAGMDRIIVRKNPLIDRKLVIGIGAVLILFGGMMALRSRALMISNIDASRLEIATVTEGPFIETIGVNGIIQPRASMFVNNPVGGQVEKIYVEEGAHVTKGQPLVLLSNTDLQLEITQQESKLVSLRENLQNVQMEKEQQKFSYEQQIKQLEFDIEQKKRLIQRNEILRQNGLISVQDYEKTKDEYAYLMKKLELLKDTYRQHMALFELQIKQLESNVRQMESNVQLLRDKLNSLLVRAPVSGQLTQFEVEPGQYIEARARLARIDDLSSYRIEAQVSEYYLPRIRKGLQGRLMADNRTYSVFVDKVFPAVEDGTFKIELLFFKHPDHNFHPGQSVRVDLQLSGSETAILVPRGGFYRSTGGTWIFVLDPDGHRARRREIRIGRQNASHYEVLSGLHPGERVIISPYLGFVNKSEIRIRSKS